MEKLSKKIESLGERLESFIEKSSLWESVFNESPFATCILNDQLKFVMINDTFIRLTKWNRRDLIGKNLNLLIPKEYRQQHDMNVKQFSLSSEKRLGNMGKSPKMLNKNNVPIDVEISLSSIQLNGMSYYICYIRTISDIKGSLGMK